ncbi:MAG: ABC-type dipeptide/oligopeptide/nickel transport system, permease component [halophilic archaeon J07HX5]|nr:MAG: ABC-type dipeptide/oligopeptide/nickel transport system, permease component [halophilic archaeon J07HX5]
MPVRRQPSRQCETTVTLAANDTTAVVSYFRYAFERVILAVLSVYAVVTVLFFAATGTAWFEIRERLAVAGFNNADQAATSALRDRLIAERGLDRPLYSRYADWLVDVATLQGGESLVYRASVVSVLDGRVQTTLGYVIPGIVLGVVLGVGLGVFVALRRDGVLDWTARLGAYAMLGVPSFMLVLYARFFDSLTLGAGDLDTWVVSSLVVASAVLAGQLRFARTAALEQTGRAFVTALRAKGASRIHLLRHVLRTPRYRCCRCRSASCCR